MAAVTIAAALASAAHLIASPLVIPPFLASTVSRRFAVVQADASIDAEGLWLGDTLVAARADILDVWADREDTEHRVSVAVKPDLLYVMHLPNAGQACRFAEALAPASPDDDHGRRVAGIRPHLIDALMPLRLLALAISFLGNTGRPQAPAVLVLLALFLWAAYGFVVAKQIDAGPDGLTLRTFAGARTIPWSGVTDEALDALPKRAVRSALLSTSPWTNRAHARVVAHARREMKQRRDS